MSDPTRESEDALLQQLCEADAGTEVPPGQAITPATLLRRQRQHRRRAIGTGAAVAFTCVLLLTCWPRATANAAEDQLLATGTAANDGPVQALARDVDRLAARLDTLMTSLTESPNTPPLALHAGQTIHDHLRLQLADARASTLFAAPKSKPRIR